MVRRIPDLPKVPGDPMAGFWGDDKAWTAAWISWVKACFCSVPKVLWHSCNVCESALFHFVPRICSANL